jgi:F-type H+-transporting ATPase subunit delta
MKDTVAARKYARVLFNEAQKTNQIRACQQGLEELARITRMRDSLRAILVQPFIASPEKQKLIHASLGEYATPLLERFLTILVRARRMELLPLIIDYFEEEVDRSKNAQEVRVRSAFPLTEAQKKTLEEKLEGWLNSKVRLKVGVDPELIGGLVMETRDYRLDQSLRTRLKKLEETLIG